MPKRSRIAAEMPTVPGRRRIRCHSMWPSGVSVSLMLSRWKVTLMKAGSNSRRASIVVKTLRVPSPLSGGSNSNEKRVVSRAEVSRMISSTFMFRRCSE